VCGDDDPQHTPATSRRRETRNYLLTLIVIGIDREVIDPARLVPADAAAHPRLLRGQFPHLEPVPHERIQRERRPVENVGRSLEDEAPVVGVYPVYLDATAALVHDVDRSRDRSCGVRDRDEGIAMEEEEEQLEQ